MRIVRGLVLSALLLVVGFPLLLLTLGAKGDGTMHRGLMRDAVPAAPDYTSPDAWAAWPGRADRADVAPLPGTRDEQATAAADVFFVHAAASWTLWWNVPVDHPVARWLVDGTLIEQWASAFNGCCRVYAPRFRQEGMFRPRDEARFRQALDLAYEDVRTAFRHYLARENQGRPIVIAGAQSGGRHALRLLIEEFAGQPLRAQLVAAYLVGASIDADTRAQLRDIPVCNGPTELGCVNNWRARGREATEVLAHHQGEACVNPLSWRADEIYVPAEANLGSIEGRLFGTDPLPTVRGNVAAQCEEGVLWVEPQDDVWRWQPNGPGDYHIQNYMFFYGNIRANARERVETFLRAGS